MDNPNVTAFIPVTKEVDKRFKIIFILIGILIITSIVIFVIFIAGPKSSSGDIKQIIDSLRQENAVLQLKGDSLKLYADSLRSDIAFIKEERKLINKRIAGYDNKLNNLNNELQNITPRYHDVVGDSLRRKFAEQFGN